VWFVNTTPTNKKMARILDTSFYERLLAKQKEESVDTSGFLPPGVTPVEMATPGTRHKKIVEAIEGTAGSADTKVQFYHELLKNRFDMGGIPLLEIQKKFGQTIQELAQDKLIFDLEIEILFGNSYIYDFTNYNDSLGGNLDNYGNAGGYPSTTGNKSGGGRSNGTRK